MDEPTQGPGESAGLSEFGWRLSLARGLLETAWFGLETLQSERARNWIDGFRIVTVFGRSTTLAVQNALKHMPGFEDWYAGEQLAMRGDDLLQWFLKARNVILKEAAVIPDMSGIFVHGDGVAPAAHLTVPLHHRGKLVDDASLQNVAALYVLYLHDFIDRAETWLRGRETTQPDLRP